MARLSHLASLLTRLLLVSLSILISFASSTNILVKRGNYLKKGQWPDNNIRFFYNSPDDKKEVGPTVNAGIKHLQDHRISKGTPAQGAI